MNSRPELDIRRLWDEATMSPVQKAAVATTVVLSAMDGYDVLSMTFAAPAITHAWGIGKGMLGVLLSCGLAGMALGSITLAPLADTVGRRKIVLSTLVITAIGMLLSALATSLAQLAILRVFTGFGVGACVSVINPLAAEFSNARWRSFAVSAMAMGYPLGGVIGGLLAGLLLKLYGWPAVFLAGGLIALVLIPMVAWWVPEPLSFLLSRRAENRLERVNALLIKCGHAVARTLAVIEPTSRRGYALLFTASQWRTTAWITAANVLFVTTVYFVFSWFPQMVSDAGFAPSTASLVVAVLNLIGVLGGFSLGALATQASLRPLTGTAATGFGIATAVFGVTPASLPLMFLIAGVCGLFLCAGAAGIFSTISTCFAAEARASGSGFVIGVGRIASAIAPSLAGWLFVAGLGRSGVCAAFGVCALLAGGLLLANPAHRSLPSTG